MLADGCEKSRIFSVESTELTLSRINELLNRSLMLVTALSPEIGYSDLLVLQRFYKMVLSTVKYL